MEGLSLTIPFYNEESILRSTLEDTWNYLEGLNRPFELILGDDGSTDESHQIAEAFEARHPDRCRIISNQSNQGRGSILTQSFSSASMPIVAYIDADLEIPLSFLGELLSKFSDPHVKVCTGTKLVSQQKSVRARHRKCASHVFNFFVRVFLHSNVSDHQCGLKGFRREVLAKILPSAQEKGWAWDTEMLLLSQKDGHRVHEFNVQLQTRRKSTVPFVRTIVLFLVKIFAFRRRGLAL